MPSSSYFSYLLGPVEASMQSHVAIEGLVVLEHAATLGALHRLRGPAVGGGGGGGEHSTRVYESTGYYVCVSLQGIVCAGFPTR